MTGSGTPWESSSTVSFSGHCALAMRQRSSSSFAFGTSKENGRIESPALEPCATAAMNGLMDRPADPASKARRGGDNGSCGLSNDIEGSLVDVGHDTMR